MSDLVIRKRYSGWVVLVLSERKDSLEKIDIVTPLVLKRINTPNEYSLRPPDRHQESSTLKTKY